ncbi:MAG: hypothetical protein OES79_04080, partial [Planctomycetota bacterium]|nr:hypothetical protein [Planctomycetota bacterium]
MMLVLRSDLVFIPKRVAGEPFYLIEDRTRSRFFDIGLPEYTLISFLDGKTTIGEALSLLAKARPELALTEQEAASICKWLIDAELAYTFESVRSQRLAEAAKTHDRKKILATWNPLCSKVPLLYPNRFFDQIHPWLGWINSLPAALVILLVAVAAMYRVQLHWDELAAASAGIFSPGRWLWLVLCWLMLKIVHELAHGLACKKHGGAVHEAGVMFILFAPLAYVDVTSSWRFDSKWQRIHVAAAGMYVELFIAAVAAILWTVTGPGLFNDICFNLLLMASLTTLAFNANPLMRFDGYYILSDLLEIPNLYGDGQQYVRYLGRRYLMGVRTESPLEFELRDLFVRVYGVASLFWRIFICAVMVMAAATLFHGIGLILALLA